MLPLQATEFLQQQKIAREKRFSRNFYVKKS